jgi:MFS family permease
VIRSRRAILALLTALNLVNYIDRFIVMAVSPKIQESLSLTDTQVGAVVSVFMFGYFLTSPLFGWLGDRYPRKGLIAAGVAIWSIATVCSGLAGSLVSMLLARAVVGVGEASYATLSPTIIDDISTKESKNRWLAIFYVAIPVGSALGFLLGGLLEHHFDWHIAFFVAGGPGVLLALLALLIEEPRRVAPRERAQKGAARELAKQPSYVYAVAGYVAQTFALGGFTAWAAPFLYRKLCLELHDADFVFGAITAVTGLVGTGVGGLVADRVRGEDRTRAALRVCAWSSAVAAPLALVALLMPTAVGFFIAMGVCELAIFASVSPTNAAVLLSAPAGLRASAMAISIFAIHLFGDLVSPPVIGLLSDAFGDSRDKCSGAPGLQMGMYLLPVALAISAALWWRGATRREAPAQTVVSS